MRWRRALLRVAVAALAATLSSVAPSRGEGADELVVFPLWAGYSLSVQDSAWLPNGEIVLLEDRGLSRIGLSGHVARLPMAVSVRPDVDNGLAVAPDGAVFFSERGRVLRRAADGTVTVIAGRAEPAEASGDGGPAVGAGMRPTRLATQAGGALLIADQGNHRVRRVDRTGRIATVAGTGRAGSSGDGGPATQARLTAPFAVSSFPDGSFLIAEGTDRIRIRRVGVDGRIATVAGGAGSTSRGCPRAAVPAASFRIERDYLPGDVAALASGGFLFSSERGIFQVSDAGLLTSVSCGSPFSGSARAIYIHGRRAGDAVLSPIMSIDVASDGSILLDSAVLLAGPGAQRLAVALAPETLARVHGGGVVVQSTDVATVTLRALRGRRVVQRLTAEVGPGRTELRLPRRLRGDIHTLRLTATDARGREATDRLRVLGRHRLSTRLARRFVRRGFDDNYTGEGEYSLRIARCRHRGPRVVRCKTTVAPLDREPVRKWWTASVTLRRDGVLVYRIRFGSDKPESSIIRP